MALLLTILRWLAIAALVIAAAIHVSYAALYIILAAIVLVAPYLRRYARRYIV